MILRRRSNAELEQRIIHAILKGDHVGARRWWSKLYPRLTPPQMLQTQYRIMAAVQPGTDSLAADALIRSTGASPPHAEEPV